MTSDSHVRRSVSSSSYCSSGAATVSSLNCGTLGKESNRKHHIKAGVICLVQGDRCGLLVADRCWESWHTCAGAGVLGCMGAPCLTLRPLMAFTSTDDLGPSVLCHCAGLVSTSVCAHSATIRGAGGGTSAQLSGPRGMVNPILRWCYHCALSPCRPQRSQPCTAALRA